jgi:hypothetical protein
VVSDHHGDGQRDGRVQPVPAPASQDDRARHGHAGRGGGIRDGVEQDRRDGQVALLALAAVVPAQDEGGRRHRQGGNAAGYQHGQAIHPGRPGGEPVCRYGGDEKFEHQQPSAVDQRGEARRAQVGRPPPAARPAGRKADRQQGQARARGIEEIVTAFGEHPDGMSADTHHDQAGHQREVKPQHHHQPLRPGHLGPAG